MSFTWSPDLEPPGVRITAAGWARVVLRALPLILVLVSGVIVMGLMRFVERPLFGLSRPWTPTITVIVCRLALLILGIRQTVEGQVMKEAGALVSNHSSWLDIFTLNAVRRIYFVSKAEVAGWPGIGLLARITGTVFITRDRKLAKAQQDVFETRLKEGHRLLFFPEGTSTDGFCVLPFKTTLFQAFFDQSLRDVVSVQPLTVVYTSPSGQDPRFFGWWGDMDFGPHALNVLAAGGGGHVRVICHPAVAVRDFADRKSLARHLEQTVRSGMPEARRLSG